MTGGIAAEVFMTAEERERVQQLCTVIQNEMEHSKLTDLLQELLELLESNEHCGFADREKKNPSR